MKTRWDLIKLAHTRTGFSVEFLKLQTWTNLLRMAGLLEDGGIDAY